MRNAMLALAVAGALVAGCGLLKDVGRTINDIARDLCELHFGEHPEQLERLGDKLGMPAVTAVDVCSMHDVVAPFIDELLSAGGESAEALGVAGP